MIDYPRIVITSGEPAGIGPDLCLQLAQYDFPCELIVIADPNLLEQRAKQLKLTVSLEESDLTKPARPSIKGKLRYLALDLAQTCHAGELDHRNANYVLRMLATALNGCMSGQFDAMVTAPVHKGVINDAGIDFTGHTEFLADGAGVDKVVMMLATEQLRVALATTHLPLKDVSSQITQPSLNKIISIIETSLQNQFGMTSPRIAVCGLNPHAGEGGHLGREEIDVISPVIDSYLQRGTSISGPWPADTIFVDEKLKQFDVVLAMYHDQGLPVLKHHGFGQAVNVTLGLPFIRTSVDHGTALELAGTGQAKSTSLIAAINMALAMYKSRAIS